MEILITRALLFWVCTSNPDFGELPYLQEAQLPIDGVMFIPTTVLLCALGRYTFGQVHLHDIAWRICT